jgi:hypothetical protein
MPPSENPAALKSGGGLGDAKFMEECSTLPPIDRSNFDCDQN